jgi:hypothetical protein
MKIKFKWFILISFIITLSSVPFVPYIMNAQEAVEETIQETIQEPSKETELQLEAIPLSEVTATTLYAENEKFNLYLDEETGMIRITDKKSGKEWIGSPPVESTMGPNNKKFIDAPIHISYTEGVGDSNTYPAREKETKMKIVKIDKGVRIEFHLTKLKLSFAMEYHLNNSGFEVRIPFDSIKEEGTVRLMSLEVLPFFEAGAENEKGAMFLPDGSGTIIKFKEEHPLYFDFYSEYIYGGDHAFLTKVYKRVVPIRRELISYGPKHHAALPVFGTYKEEQAFLGIVTEGDHNAKIKGTTAGARNIKLYRTSAEFFYRNNDIVFIRNSGEIPLTQREIIPGDRAVKYILLQNEKSNYVGMAHAYRDYLIEEKGLKPITSKKNMNFQLRLFGGVLRDDIIGSTFISLTTFDQVRAILEAYIANGIDSIEVTIDGWSKNGVFGDHPKHLPAEGKLGGNKELEALAAYTKDKGIHLSLKTNYVKPYEDSRELKPSRDAIRGLNKNVMEVFTPYVTTNQPSNDKFYFLKPQRVFDKYIISEAEKFSKIGIQGVHLGYMGDTLYSDQDSNSLFSRKDTMDTWVNSMDLMRKKLGFTAVDYGFAYTLGHVDRIDDIPLSSSNYIFTDESIPFYQIAIHGLIPYTAQPMNLTDDPRTSLLRVIEYGAIPSFELTYEHSSKLKRSMVNYLYSSHYEQWLQPSSKIYQEVREVLNKVSDQMISNHEKLDEGVYRTTFSNNLQVIVNYGYKPVTVGDDVVDAYDYVIREGRE